MCTTTTTWIGLIFYAFVNFELPILGSLYANFFVIFVVIVVVAPSWICHAVVYDLPSFSRANACFSCTANISSWISLCFFTLSPIDIQTTAQNKIWRLKEAKQQWGHWWRLKRLNHFQANEMPLPTLLIEDVGFVSALLLPQTPIKS